MSYPSDIHLILRNARRSAGLTQTALAEQVGCMQSAISMMESGRMDVLSRVTLEKIAAILDVTLETPAPAGGTVQTLPPPVHRFCPNPECPSCLPYLVGDEMFFLPRPAPATGRYCHLCGEVLAENCPGCDAPCSVPSACCSDCGHPLIAPPPTVTPANRGEWLRQRQSTIDNIQHWQSPDTATK